MPAIEGSLSCAYELDEQFRIVWVDERWSAFALENGAPELVAPAPIGRSIWSSIADGTTSLLWGQIFQKVRRTGRPLVVPIRCDSPTLRRYLQLLVSVGSPSCLRIESLVVRVEPKPPAVVIERTMVAPALLRMCSWCKQLDLQGRWVEVEVLTSEQRLFERDVLPALTHGMCPSCHAHMTSILDG